MLKKIKSFPILLIVFLFTFSCNEDETPLAPYMGERQLGKVAIEEESFVPKVTWVGGYVSIFGVNQDSVAKLDSTLIMLIYAKNNNIQFPVKFGQVPDGAENLVSQFGGHEVDTLVEDKTYTFWLLKEKAWDMVKTNPHKPIRVDNHVENVTVTDDTVLVNPDNYVSAVKSLDVFVNIKNVSTRGRLGPINIVQTNKIKDPTITWEITQEGAGDTRIAAMGLVKAALYDANNIVWEVWSEEPGEDLPVYGSKNVISQPVVLGQTFPETRTFYEYPEEGLERNKTYYLWIANNKWDGEKHSRVADYYAYATFKTY